MDLGNIRFICYLPLANLKPWSVIVWTISGNTSWKSFCDDMVTLITKMVYRNPSRSALACNSSLVGTKAKLAIVVDEGAPCGRYP